MGKNNKSYIKTAILTTSFPDHKNSYRGKFIEHFAKELIKRKIKPFVITAKIFDKSPFHEEYDGISLFRFPFLSENRLIIEYKKTPLFRMISYMISCFMCTVLLLFRENISIIHAHFILPAGLIAVLIAKIFNKPVLLTAHGSDICVLPRKSKLLRYLTIITLKNADFVTSVGEHLTAKIIRWGIDKDKIMTLPMGLDLETFHPISKSQDCDFTVLSNRNLHPVYDLDTLIRSIPEILKVYPSANFLIAGQGPQKEHLRKLATEMGVYDRIRFLGYVPNDEMPTLLGKATVYISTSTSDGTSVSLLEALACGPFPVVTDIAANRSWIENGKNGFLFECSNPRKLAEKVNIALGDRNLRETAAIYNQKMVKARASWGYVIAEYLRIYRSLFNGENK
ncbi:glycosyltransferase [bacterium]|nr:glycosyltransferase [bacterium]